jgi:adenylyltransferase/sulfurtransferase
MLLGMTEPPLSGISSHRSPTRPRLRAGLSLTAGEQELLVVSPRLRSADAIDDPDGMWASLLGACDGVAGLDGVRARMLRDGFDLSPGDVSEGVDALVVAGIVVDAAHDVLDDWANQRAYIEQLVRGDLDVADAQRRVQRTRAVVIGAGGTGSWLCLSLAMMGVGELVVVDPDVVEPRNLSRQPYPAGSVGRRKVEVIGEIVTGLRPALEFSGVDLRVEGADDLAPLIEGADVVACCADEPTLGTIAAIIADACVPARVPHLICGYHGASGRVGPFWYPRRRPLPCAGCHALEVEPDRARAVRERNAIRTPFAVSVAQPQLVASLAAAEILHLRAGVTPATAGKLFALDSLTLDSRRLRVALRDDCPSCRGGRTGRLRASAAAGVTGPREEVIR